MHSPIEENESTVLLIEQLTQQAEEEEEQLDREYFALESDIGDLEKCKLLKKDNEIYQASNGEFREYDRCKILTHEGNELKKSKIEWLKSRNEHLRKQILEYKLKNNK